MIWGYHYFWKHPCFGDSDEWNELRACKQSGMWICIRMIGTYQMNLPIYTDCIGRCTDVRFLGSLNPSACGSICGISHTKDASQIGICWFLVEGSRMGGKGILYTQLVFEKNEVPSNPSFCIKTIEPKPQYSMMVGLCGNVAALVPLCWGYVPLGFFLWCDITELMDLAFSQPTKRSNTRSKRNSSWLCPRRVPGTQKLVWLEQGLGSQKDGSYVFGGVASQRLVVDQRMVISWYPGVVSKSKRPRVLWKTTSCECESTYIIPSCQLVVWSLLGCFHVQFHLNL